MEAPSSASSSSSQSSEKSHTIPPFLSKLYDLVDDRATDSTVSWSPNDPSFVIWDVSAVEQELLPKYFKHNNFSSFIRQLNTYGFRKTNPDRWEFANDGFVKGQKHLLRNIGRRKATQSSQSNGQHRKPQQKNTSAAPCVEIGKIGLRDEVEMLKSDKNVLAQELVKFRQHQKNSENKLHVLTQRIQGMEINQQQMLSFLAMAVQSPGFLAQFLQQNESNWRTAERSRKRPLPALEQGAQECETMGQIVRYQSPITENVTSQNNLNQNIEVSQFLDSSLKKSPFPAPKQSMQDCVNVVPLPDGQIVRYQPLKNENSTSQDIPMSIIDISQPLDPSLDELDDLFANIDFSSFGDVPMELNPFSENEGPFILPELPEDNVIEQFLLGSSVLDNIGNAEQIPMEILENWVEEGSGNDAPVDKS
ncbi:hypothetical protein Sjap_014747 [Stephania japonica]|uniref:HSF-type DNA-binding domain-containing protein n=1 Tax=Stephania japonica TaxID=461633 RepID=A0AAP0IIN3_9MAGN